MTEHFAPSSPDDAPGEFSLKRALDAPRELVFRAWTDPAQLTRWWGPRGFTAPRQDIAVDLRPGGAWRAVLLSPDGDAHPSGGVYREVLAPERLVFTWGVSSDRKPVRDDSLITVTFTELAGGRTELVLRHSSRHTEGERANAREGWSTCLDRLTALAGSLDTP